MASAFVIAHSLAVLDQLIPFVQWTGMAALLLALLWLFRPLLSGLAKAAWLIVRPRRARCARRSPVLGAAK